MEGSDDAAAAGADGTSSGDFDPREEADSKQNSGRGSRQESRFFTYLMKQTQRELSVSGPQGDS